MVSVKPSLAVKIGKLQLPYPTLMGSGCYGSGEEYAPFADLSKLGAIVLKSVTRLPRLGNPTPRLVHTPAGMLNAIGLQNPGIDWYLERELPKYAGRPCTLIGSVAGFSIDDYAYVCERLAARDEIAAVELNVSCPNVASEGETFGCDPGLTARVVRAARSTTDKTLIVKLSPNVTSIAEVAAEAEAAGADALAVINTVRGMAIDVENWQPRLGNITGGLSGPAIRPIAVLAVYEVARKVKIPIVGQGGIENLCACFISRRSDGDFDRYGKLHRSPDSRAYRGGAGAIPRAAQPLRRRRDCRSRQRRTRNARPIRRR